MNDATRYVIAFLEAVGDDLDNLTGNAAARSFVYCVFVREEEIEFDKLSARQKRQISYALAALQNGVLERASGQGV